MGSCTQPFGDKRGTINEQSPIIKAQTLTGRIYAGQGRLFINPTPPETSPRIQGATTAPQDSLHKRGSNWVQGSALHL
jgi:hypothetical protein